jgi:DnaK suppressor protein
MVAKQTKKNPAKARNKPKSTRTAPKGKKAARKVTRGPASKAKKVPPRAAKKSTKKKAKAKRRKSAAELRKFKRLLIEKREELLEAYHSSKGDSRSRVDDGTEDYIDYAVSSYDREFLLSLTEMEQRHLALVEEALTRVDRRVDYGRCAQCQQEIPSKRLEVQPWARYCLPCQELDEQGLLVAEDRETDSEDDEEDDDLDVEGDEEPDVDDASDDVLESSTG